MKILLIAAFVLFAGLIIASKMVSEKAFKLLSDKEKIMLSDLFSNFRKFQIMPILFVFIIYIIVFVLFTKFIFMAINVIFSVIIVYYIVLGTVYNLKIKKVDLPVKYKKMTCISNGILILSFIIGFGGFLVYLNFNN